MRNWAWAAAAVLLATAPACGGGDGGGGAALLQAQITSRQSADGDVAFDRTTSVYTITTAGQNQNVLFGVDSSSPGTPEYRAFLDFPLDGSSGGPVVPADARLQAATLELFIQSTDFSSTIPTLIELVPYPTTGPRDTDYNSPAITFRSLNVFASDAGAFLDIDVDALMADALSQALRDFQVRITLDPSATVGLVQIADGVPNEAPLLVVDFY